MKRLIFAQSVRLRFAELQTAGADFRLYDAALGALQRGRELPPHFRDHALRAPLTGYRSCIVGFTPEDKTIVAVYKSSPRQVIVFAVDEHDQAYESMIERD